jgi:acyl carrier protein
MVSVALVQRSSAELFLSSEIHAFIAQHLKVDVASMDAHSHLTEDFGLDLFEITALLTVLEERFGVDAETADEPNQIEFVGDLIGYIESSTKEEKTRTDRLIPMSESGSRIFNRRGRSINPAEPLSRPSPRAVDHDGEEAQPDSNAKTYGSNSHPHCPLLILIFSTNSRRER